MVTKTTPPQNQYPQNNNTSAVVSEPAQSYNIEESISIKRNSTPTRKQRRKSSLSISSHFEEKKQNKKEVELDLSNMPKDSFTYDEMLKHWYDYAELLNNKGDQLLYSAMTRENPKLENNTIICSILNQTLFAKFESENVKLIQYIREKLNNFSVQFETPITKMEDVKQIYSSREKYEFMLKKNALLEDLVIKLQLSLI